VEYPKDRCQEPRWGHRLSRVSAPSDAAAAPIPSGHITAYPMPLWPISPRYGCSLSTRSLTSPPTPRRVLRKASTHFPHRGARPADEPHSPKAPLNPLADLSATERSPPPIAPRPDSFRRAIASRQPRVRAPRAPARHHLSHAGRNQCSPINRSSTVLRALDLARPLRAHAAIPLGDPRKSPPSERPSQPLKRRTV
jgi:hypothetical protein